MDELELVRFIKERLSIRARKRYSVYGDEYIQVELLLDGEEFAYDTFDLPKECE